MEQFKIFLNGVARMLVIISLIAVCINAICSKQTFIITIGIIGLVGVIYNVYKLFRDTRRN